MRFHAAVGLGLVAVAAAFLDPLPKHIFRESVAGPKLVIRGVDVQAAKRYDGRLDNYKMSINTPDPSVLGVDTVKQYSGYLNDDHADKHLFYWFFESRNDPQNDPVILWINGGPGCSSMLGLLMALGPSFLNEDGKLVPNKYSWNSNASVIFIDQPVNTGFSYSNTPVSNSYAASQDIYALLTLFFEQFPQYSHQDFHLAGESYAGHFIPVFAAEILSHQNRNINLKSIMIGNGLVNPYVQYGSMEPMGCGRGGYQAIFDQQTCAFMHNQVLPDCRGRIRECLNGYPGACEYASFVCEQLIMPIEKTGRNVYDIRKPCVKPGMCYETKHVEEWLNSEEVMQALGSHIHRYSVCNQGVNEAFRRTGDLFSPTYMHLPDVLAQIPLLVYAGDTDYICNWLGNYAWTHALQWQGQDAFRAAQTTELTTSSGTKYGSIKSAQGLAFLRVYGAGHMVPLDQPEAALDFLNRWLRGEWTK